MSKLNLDIFESRVTTESQKALENKTSKDRTEAITPHRPEEAARAQDSAGKKTERETPKFVPVGFDQECLRLLDDAVLLLRRRGHWKASKSAIVRLLVKEHAGTLVDLYESGLGQHI